MFFLWLCSDRVIENERINKMSLQNLATVFGPTLLGPSEKDSKVAQSSQPIVQDDRWYLDEVRCQVKICAKVVSKTRWRVRQLHLYWIRVGVIPFLCVSEGASSSLHPPAGEHPDTWQQTSKPSDLHRSITAKSHSWSPIKVVCRGQSAGCTMCPMLLAGGGCLN